MNTIAEHLAQVPTFTPSVVAFAVAEGKVLLGLRKKVSNGLGENLISGIGGKVGDMPEFADETNDEAMIREMQEESGITPTVFRHAGRVRFIFPNKPKWNHDVAIYEITEWTGELTESDAMKPEWYPVDNLPSSQMWADNSVWVPRVLAGEIIDAVFMYNEDNQTIGEYLFEA